CDKYEMYFNQLADCCVLFVNKNPAVASVILGGLLKFWPHLSPTKQAFFLREMLSIVGALVEHEKGFEYQDYKDILRSTLDQILTCVGSTHFQVADTALTLWKDTVIVYLSKREKEYVWRKLFALLKENIRGHWNSTIVQMSEELQHFYEGVDSEYWHSLDTEFQKKREQLNKELNDQSSTNTPYTPYSPTSPNDEPEGTLLAPPEDKFARQVSLVHEFDQRQLHLSRERKATFFFFSALRKKIQRRRSTYDIRRASRWEQIYKVAGVKPVKSIETPEHKDIDTEIDTPQLMDKTHTQGASVSGETNTSSTGQSVNIADIPSTVPNKGDTSTTEPHLTNDIQFFTFLIVTTFFCFNCLLLSERMKRKLHTVNFLVFLSFCFKQQFVVGQGFQKFSLLSTGIPISIVKFNFLEKFDY
ncbi:hypothetical protein RFI_23842, partial [Reticulomyxa filosa]